MFSIKNHLSREASALRLALTNKRDSEDSIIDVVDPNLFPFVFGMTKTLRSPAYILPVNCITRTGEGEPVKMPREGDTKQEERGKYPNDMAWSRRFQWLPFDVTWENGGNGRSR